jgi:hypothetical protein
MTGRLDPDPQAARRSKATSRRSGETDADHRRTLFGRTHGDPVFGCWVWSGATNRKGYGVYIFRGKYVGAHRVAWTLFRGPIPDGLFVLHRCDNPPCLNPDHLFLGTHNDNMIDMVLKGRGPVRTFKTHCKYGHEFTPQNTRITPGRRDCRACWNRRQKDYYAKVKAARERRVVSE